MDKVEHVILENLISNEPFARNVLPHLKDEYFDNRVEKAIFVFINSFFNDHNKLPTKKILKLIAKEYQKFKQEDYEEAIKIIEDFGDKEDNIEWLTNRTEKFCKDAALYNALRHAIAIVDGEDKKFSLEGIPTLLQDALSVAFDKNVGHDYIEDAESRWEFYNKREDKIPWPWEIFNKITGGGVSRKTLNLFFMPPKTGKTLAMCDFAAFCILNGYKALYITLEMAEERIAERIDANLFNLTMPEIEKMSKTAFMKKMSDTYKGNLVIKEYPTAGAHAGHFQTLIEELKTKKNFIPDIIFIDYLNICASQRMKMGGSVNTYQYIKSVGEELRGLAIQYNVPMISASQTNRSGVGNSDLGAENLSDSFGTAMTVDFMIAGVRNEELDGLNQILFSQVLSRYGDINYYRRFVMGIDLPHFKLYDLEDSAQQSVSERGDTDDKPVFDNTKFGKRLSGGKELDFS